MRFVYLFILIMGLAQAKTQHLSLGLSAGAANYNGDLTENIRSSIKQSHPYFGVQAILDLDQVFSLQLQYVKTKVSGNDALASSPLLRARNLNFESNINEISLVGQMRILNLFREEPLKFSPYLQLGLAHFSFNPRTEYGGVMVDLQPLGTEGQGMSFYPDRYHLNSTAFISGFGARYQHNANFSLSLEFNFRLLSTDYLDDASGDYVSYEELNQFRGRTSAELGNKIRAATGRQRANPKSNDSYQSLSLGIQYHFGKNPYFRNSLYKKPVRCFSF